MKIPKNGFPDDPDEEESTELKDAGEDNLFMLMANPYMKAVKHDEAVREAKKNKKPI